MDSAINNIDDLKNEIARLKIDKTLQEQELKAHFDGPAAIFKTVTSLFQGSPAKTQGASGIASLFAHQDVVSMLSRVVIPFVLNKTLFRGSNFIIKAAIGLLSQKASGYVTEKNIAGIWDKIKGFLPKQKSTVKPAATYAVSPVMYK